MNRRRLAIATTVAEWGVPLSLAMLVVLFAVITGPILWITVQLPVSQGARVAFGANFLILFVSQYGRFAVQTARALRRPRLQDSAFRVERGAAAALYRVVDEVARDLGVRPPRSIWLAAGFECAVRADGRAYDLVLGVPLLDLLNVDELRAAVATDTARSFGGDPITARAYRALLFWSDVIRHAQATDDRAGALLGAGLFGRWLDPRTVLEREAYARNAAAKIHGADEVTVALARPAIYAGYTDEVFWRGLVERHALNAQPPDAISQLRAVCRAPIPSKESIRRSNAAAIERELGKDMPDDVNRATWTPASDALARDVSTKAGRAFDEAWRRRVEPQWLEASEAAHAEQAELEELDQRLPREGLSDAEAWQRLELIERRRGADVVLPLYREWLHGHPNDARAAFATGRVAFDLRSADAVELLEQAMSLDERFEAAGSGLIFSDLIAQDREIDAAAYRERFDAAASKLNAALTERAAMFKTRPPRPHDLAPHELAAVTKHIARFPMIASVFASRVDAEIMPTVRCLVLAVRFKRTWSWLHGEKKAETLAAIATAPLDGQLVAVEVSRHRSFGREPAVELYRAQPEPRAVRFARWGRRAQRVLIGAGLLLVLITGIQYRDCFPECWEDMSAILLLGPIIVAINALLLTGSPDAPQQRSVAFATSAFFAGMFFFGQLIPLVPIAFAGFMRAPQTRHASMWAVGMSVPAFILGWFVTIV